MPKYKYLSEVGGYESKKRICGPFACEEYIKPLAQSQDYHCENGFDGLNIDGYLNMLVIPILDVTKVETFFIVG
jgi:hypothetical protein